MADAGQPQRYSYRDHSVWEKTVGLGWLSVGAVGSLLLETVYLGARLTLPGGMTIVCPIMILVAAGFTYVLSRTALLWTDRVAVAAIPLAVWVAGYAVLLFWPVFMGDVIYAQSLRSVALLMAACCGGGWPLLIRK